MDYRIFPPEEILETTVSLPPSKSMAVRAAVLAALAGDATASARFGEACTDARVAADAMAALNRGDADINVGACGAALRFVTAIAAATPGADVTVDGSDRLRRRPMAPLIDALRSLGADITCTAAEGFAPLHIRGKRLDGGKVAIDASKSSQFVSALMLAAPSMTQGLVIDPGAHVQSAPYARLTECMMAHYGITTDTVAVEGRPAIAVLPGKYRPADIAIEPDWSAADFWYEIAALTAGWVTLKGLRAGSPQPDAVTAGLFERLGVLTEYTDEGAELSATPDLFNRLDADLTDTPDAVPSLVTTACLIGMPFRLTGVAVLRHKECDRLQALIDEMRKVGAMLVTEEYDNVLSWDGRRMPVRELPVFDTYDDHRMAMAFAPVAVYIPGIVVRDVEVVDKSYPGYWDALRAAGFTLADPADPMPATEEP